MGHEQREATKAGRETGGYVLEITIRDLPKTTNSLTKTGWRGRLSESRKWHTLVGVATPIQKRPIAPLTRAKLTLTRHSSVEPDYDGLVSSFKFIVDALILAKVIANDRYSNIGRSEYVWERAPRNDGYVTVKVEAA